MTTETFKHVTFLNGQFVLSGAATYQSVDGYNWNRVSDRGFFGVSYSPVSGLYIGVPGAGIHTSPDLKNWTRAWIENDLPELLFFSATPLQTPEGHLIVSGQVGGNIQGQYRASFWLSKDGGATWWQLPFRLPVCNHQLAQLAYANKTVYASCPGTCSVSQI